MRPLSLPVPTTRPIVFFCQNNQWAISEPFERQSRVPLYRRASGFGFPGVRVDGNDVLAVYAATTAALERARSGSGPSLIEAYHLSHGRIRTSDDPTKYRLADELEHWQAGKFDCASSAHLTRSGSGDERSLPTLRPKRRLRGRPPNPLPGSSDPNLWIF
jgi:pyruvate dehydrogenase E1 component alpha subunit